MEPLDLFLISSDFAITLIFESLDVLFSLPHVLSLLSLVNGLRSIGLSFRRLLHCGFQVIAVVEFELVLLEEALQLLQPSFVPLRSLELEIAVAGVKVLA